jgi:hypothetical protein
MTQPPGPWCCSAGQESCSGCYKTLSDTWTWNGTTWTEQKPAAHPQGRFGASIAYSAATGTVMLSGGQNNNGGLLGDTWTWDGTTWTNLAPEVHPSPRQAAAMAYDAATGTVVLFGGLTERGQLTRYLRDTWTWG